MLHLDRDSAEAAEIKALFGKYRLMAMGWNCLPRFFVNYVSHGPTLFFDYIASSLAGSAALLRARFTGVLDPDSAYICDLGNGRRYACDRRYYLRFFHDGEHPDPAKVIRRQQRTEEMLNNKKKRVLLIVLEENEPDIARRAPDHARRYYAPLDCVDFAGAQHALQTTHLRELCAAIRDVYGRDETNTKVLFFSKFAAVPKQRDDSAAGPNDDMVLELPIAAHCGDASEAWKTYHLQFAASILRHKEIVRQFLNR